MEAGTAVKAQPSHFKRDQAHPTGKTEVLPGLEPGSLDSKSRVITITLQNPTAIEKVVTVGLEPTTLGLLDPCSTI